MPFENLIVISLVIVVVALACLFGIYRRRVLEHRERMLAMEKGLPAPSDSYHQITEVLAATKRTPQDYRRRGLMWLFASLGLLVCVWRLRPVRIFDMSEPTLLAIGVVGASLGLAYLTIYFVESAGSRKTKSS
jgi:hypothetical protein